MTGAWLRRSLADEAAFLLVLAIVLVGVGTVFVVPDHWLRGVLVVAAGLLAAGVLRLVVPRSRAGLLVIRGRLFDAVCYLMLGGMVVLFGVLLPH
ncbi:MAG: DUF3017 domain-containing protein [Actinomycetota bacterium]